MFKDSYHPKAFLSRKKNVKRGLAARSKIVSFLEQNPLSAREIAEKTGTKYASVMHHLRLLESEHIIVRKEEKPFLWKLSGGGQQRLS